MKSFLFLCSIVSLLFAKDNFLGVFSTDTYPVNGCKIINAHNQLYTIEQAGTYNQYPESKKNYISEIAQTPLKDTMIKDAQEMGFNAIIGYKYYVYGGYDGFNGSMINGSLGIGVYRAGVMGNFVTVECKKFKWLWF